MNIEFEKLFKYAALLLAAFSFLRAQDAELKFGCDILLSDKIELVQNKRLGIVTNKSAVLNDGSSLIDALLDNRTLDIRAFFALEHGLELDQADGVNIRGTSVNEVEVFSLYGDTKKPTSEMLSDIDMVVFDVQDVGVRFFTFSSSLFYILGACAQYNVDVLVLDRPNPIGGMNVDGPVLKDEFKSFVGIDNIPVIHGMTIGELALLFNDRIERRADLEVVKMKGWQRNSYWADYDVDWENPSPNLIDFEITMLYPATVFFEGTNISEGRGTYTPFAIFGAPFINNKEIKSRLNSLPLEGIETRAIDYVPFPIDGKAVNPKYNGDICFGVQLKVIDREKYNPLKTAINLLNVVQDMYPDKFEMKEYFDLLWGTDQVRKDILNGLGTEEIISKWQKDLETFKEVRNNYLLY